MNQEEEKNFFECPNIKRKSRAEEKLVRSRYFDPRHGCPTLVTEDGELFQMFEVVDPEKKWQ